MIQFPHESEFRERRQAGERRRMKQSRRGGSNMHPIRTPPDYLLTNRREIQAQDEGEPDEVASPVESLVLRKGDGMPSPFFRDPVSRGLDASELRWQAEETVRLEALLDLCEALSPEATRGILHELRVHQIELEMQNEELRRAQVELGTARSRYFDLYDFAPVGYCTLNEQKQIVEANLTAAGLLGETRGALVKRSITSFILPEDQDTCYLHLKQLLETGEPKGFELRMVKTDGTAFWAHLEGTMAMEVDGEKTCRVVLSDITERKQMEAENRLLQKAESLGRMAGAIAHLFNNQLQAVMASLELLGELPHGSDPTKYLTMAKRASERAAEVSRLMLVYLGQSVGKREPQSLSELCRACLPQIQRILPESVALETDLPLPGPLVVANADQIRQVMTNLVTNAWEAMEGDDTGSVRLSLKTWLAGGIPTAHRFPVGWKPQEPDYACLEVADTGCGIASSDIDKLFDPFFTTKFTGRGLGLPVVLGIVHAHGAAVTVESKEGQGSAFRVFFPVSH